ncbi:hypothetical protein E2542_SST17535 [Spatholobus suberectus]|nr:hypothetical protein E2542_SST17535 [Spatholobus suberectus]
MTRQNHLLIGTGEEDTSTSTRDTTVTTHYLWHQHQLLFGGVPQHHLLTILLQQIQERHHHQHQVPMRMVHNHTIGKGIYGQVLDSPLPFCYLSSLDTCNSCYRSLICDHGLTLSGGLVCKTYKII